MALQSSTYVVATRGLATSFAETELPVEYALAYDNAFQNGAGGAEMRRGIAQLGSAVPGGPTVTGFAELVDRLGNTTLFATGNGSIYKYSGAAWTSIFTFATTSARIFSVMMSGKLIFYNGADPPEYTPDGTNFYELKSLIEVGELATGVSGLGMRDADIDGSSKTWLSNTFVEVNDIVHNISLDAYGAVTALLSAQVQHTRIGSAGAGGTGLGLVDASVHATQRYEIIGTTELKIIPTDDPNSFDNEAVTGAGTSATAIYVCGVNFSNLDIRAGDWIRNTTRAALTRVTAVATSALMVHGVSGQTENDSLILLKSEMPIIKDANVHFGRLWALDARDRRKVRITTKDDPMDLRSDGADLDLDDFPLGSVSLDKQTFQAGALQPEGDVLIALKTFQRFIVLVGKVKVYFFQGTEPVGSAANIEPIGVYPQGGVSQLAATNLGNDFVYVSPDGVKAVQLVQDASTFSQSHLSNQLDVTLRDLINDNSEEDIQLIHYRRRSWLMCKIGEEIYLYNFAPVVLGGRKEQVVGSWHRFTGGFARQKSFFVRQDGTMVTGGDNGIVSEYDTNVFSDNGEAYDVVYQSGWLNMIEPRTDIRQRKGFAVKPQLIVGGSTNVTVDVEAPYNRESSDTAIVSADTGLPVVGVAMVGSTIIGGSGVVNQKVPLLWQGEVARFKFTKSDSVGPYTLSRYTVYHTSTGKR